MYFARNIQPSPSQCGSNFAANIRNATLDCYAGDFVSYIHHFVAERRACFVSRDRCEHHTESNSETNPSQKSDSR